MASRKTHVKWQMHESSQRGLCRVAFVVFGVLPVFWVIALSAAQFIPAYQESRAEKWSSWLSTRLGVDVQIASVEPLAPDRYILHGLKLSHPESRAALGRIRSVEVGRKLSTWVIRLDQPELETRQLAATWQMLHDWFVCRPQQATAPIRIECELLQVRQADEGQQLEKIAVDIFTQADRTIVGAEFKMPTAAPDSKPSMLRVVRQHSDRHLSTIVELDSGLNALPVGLVAPVLPAVEQLGPQALFNGKLAVHQRNKLWQVNLTQSWLAGVDFGQLTSPFSAKLTGSGWIWCEQLKFTDRGLQSMAGGVMVQHGRIDESLLVAGQHLLGIALPRQVQAADVQLHSFEQLRAMFEIAPGTLKLAGAVEATLPETGSRKLRPGTLIADAAGEIAVRSSYEALPLKNLVAALGYGQTVVASGESDQASFEKAWFAQRAAWWLPLESNQTLLQADASSGHLER